MRHLFGSQIFSVFLLLSAFGVQAIAEKCSYQYEKDSLAIEWTAFKTTQKMAVNGSFKKVVVMGKTQASSLEKLFTGLNVSVEPRTADTGNPVRDKTLQESFFAVLSGPILGRITHVSESEKSLNLDLSLNGKQKEIPMHFEIAEDSLVKAIGSFDLLQFEGQKAIESIHAKCLDLHKGADGVSKTWSEVNLTLKARIRKICK